MKRKIPAVLLSMVLTIAVLAGCANNKAIDERPSDTPSLSDLYNQITEGAHSSIFIKNNTDGTDDGFKKLIQMMKNEDVDFYNLIDREDVVLIKINCQWDERGGTNTDLLKSIIKAIIEHPDGFIGEIIVADNGQAQYGSLRTGGSMSWKNNNAQDTSQSTQRVVDEFAENYKVSAYLWDTITTKQVEEYIGGDYEDGFILLIPENKKYEPIHHFYVFVTLSYIIELKLGEFLPEHKGQVELYLSDIR